MSWPTRSPPFRPCQRVRPPARLRELRERQPISRMRLARVEMRLGYAALLRGLPGLRLAGEPWEVSTREAAVAYGVYELPVTWDAR